VFSKKKRDEFEGKSFVKKRIMTLRSILKISILISVLLFSSFLFAQDKSFRIQYLYIDQIKYVSLNDLVKIYGGELRWDYLPKKAYWEVDEHQIAFSLFSPYVLMDGKVYNLFYRIEFKKGAFYVPLKNFYPLLKMIKAEETEFREESQSLMLEEEPEVIQLKASRKLNGLLIEIFVSGPLTYEVFSPGHNWLNINFYEAKIDTGSFSELVIPELINDTKAYQFDNSAQLSLLLSKSYDIFSHSLVSDPYRIQISMEDTSSQFTLNHLEQISQKTDLVDVVIIDPGHGGDDLGNVGSQGLMEKEAVLDIAKRLKALFHNEEDAKLEESYEHSSDLKAFLTRESDLNVPLEQRARIANQSGGDLFLSLHVNSSQDPTESGFQIFVPGLAKSREDSMVQIKENHPFTLNSSDEIKDTLSYLDTLPLDTTQTKFMRESKDLAIIVEDELRRILPTKSRGIGQADFLVLRKAYMPGIVIQIAYISSPYEELLLKDETFNKWVAQALYQAILRFKGKSPESL